MIKTAKYPTDARTERIKRLLREQYVSRHARAEIDVYRYNPVSIRVRIVDPDFVDKNSAERDDEVWGVLCRLPESICSRIELCVLVTPLERPRSLLSLDFDNPEPAPL